MSNTTKTIWLVRHGMREDFMRPAWRDTAERPHDTPLSREGWDQARETGEFLLGKGVEIIYCSPFLRAVETAAGVSDVLDIPIRIEHGLCEVLKAEWFPGPPDYIPPHVLHRRFPRIDLSYQTRVLPDFPEVEEHGDVGRRCRQAVDAMLTDGWQSALWVGHGASVGGIGWALTGHVNDVCFKLCGMTGWRGVPGAWTPIYSGVEHLSVTEEHLRFH
ncbi:MAG TPA: histidine phosphatase family protein [Kiritimatiellia bacterium]|nr:histidine phosphatase family protein [Kiritimatiellia bacterium]